MSCVAVTSTFHDVLLEPARRAQQIVFSLGFTFELVEGGVQDAAVRCSHSASGDPDRGYQGFHVASLVNSRGSAGGQAENFFDHVLPDALSLACAVSGEVLREGRVTDDFLGRLFVGDPSLSKYFTGHSADSRQRIRQHVVDFLCLATGGPCVYKGRDMKTSHAGLGITEAEWNTGVQHLVATLDKFKVPQKEKDDLLGAASGLKKDIVEK